MSVIRQVLAAACADGIPYAEQALVEFDRQQTDMVKLVAEDGTAIATLMRRPGESIHWRAPAPFFAVALALLTIEPFEPQATRLEDA